MGPLMVTCDLDRCHEQTPPNVCTKAPVCSCWNEQEQQPLQRLCCQWRTCRKGVLGLYVKQKLTG